MAETAKSLQNVPGNQAAFETGRQAEPPQRTIAALFVVEALDLGGHGSKSSLRVNQSPMQPSSVPGLSLQMARDMGGVLVRYRVHSATEAVRTLLVPMANIRQLELTE